MRVSILLLASGRSERFGGEVPKVWALLEGRTLVEHCLEAFARLTIDHEVVLTYHPEHRRPFLVSLRDRLANAGVRRFVEGGVTRQESMRRALAAADPNRNLVLVHDAARPLLPVEATRRALALAAEVGAAVVAVPAVDTLKRVDRHGMVLETVPRHDVWMAQTPQVVRRELLEEALEQAERSAFQGTDDVSLVEAMGRPVAVVEGSRRNLKVTTEEDLMLARALLAAGREEGS